MIYIQWVILYELLSLQDIKTKFNRDNIDECIIKYIPNNYLINNNLINYLKLLLSKDSKKRPTAIQAKDYAIILLNDYKQSLKPINGKFYKTFAAIQEEKKKGLFNLWNKQNSIISQQFENNPVFIECNENNVIVTESYRFHIFTQNENKVITIGNGKKSNLNGEFDYASGIIIKNEIIYICDTNNKRIQLFSIDTGRFLSKININEKPEAIKIIDENMFITTWKTNKINVYSMDGMLRHSFKCSSQPFGFTFYNNQLFVCWSNM